LYLYIVLKCLPAHLYLCLLCYVREQLDEQRLTAHNRGCGICGEMYDTRDEIKSCFFNHSISLGCGICGEMYDTRDQVKACFYEHTIDNDNNTLLYYTLSVH